MARHAESICPDHPDRFDCPDALIHVAEEGSYGIIVHDGGSSWIEIDFCPWCAAPVHAKHICGE
jgi:hypothetical protein